MRHHDGVKFEHFGVAVTMFCFITAETRKVLNVRDAGCIGTVIGQKFAYTA